MRKLIIGLMFVLVMLSAVLVPQQAQAVQVSTVAELELAYMQLEDSFWAAGGTSPVTSTINGVVIEYFVDSFNNELLLFDVTDPLNSVQIYIGPSGVAGTDVLELEALRLYLGIVLTSAGSVASPESAATATSNLVFNTLVMPLVETKTKQKQLMDKKALGMARTFGTKLAVDWVDIKNDNNDGKVYSFSMGIAWDFDNYSFGLIVPYDYLDFDIFDADRVGTVAFGQYSFDVQEDLVASLTANLNYMYTDYEFDSGGGDDVNTYGGGLSGGLRYLLENYELGCAASWQYNKDDVNISDDHQHLLKLGGNVGVHVSPEQVVNLTTVWNNDVTDYDNDYGDDDYFDVSVDYRLELNSWSLNLGYKKTLDLEDYDSDAFSIGSTWLF